tara:strand:- start:133 stop:570 length:438 start_codon:yes stop_codon:yes gene_type:complete
MNGSDINRLDYSFSTSNSVRRLSSAKRQQFITDGYLTNLPVLNASGVKDVQDLFLQLASRLPDEIDINQANMRHKASKRFYKLCRVSAILNYVKNLIGSDFVQWGGNFSYSIPATDQSAVASGWSILAFDSKPHGNCVASDLRYR